LAATKLLPKAAIRADHGRFRNSYVLLPPVWENRQENENKKARNNNIFFKMKSLWVYKDS
jgi:hypothetical protein